MFPADCLPANYCETRTQSAEAQKQKMAANEQPKLAQPIPQRPMGPPRTLSSTFFGTLFPSISHSQVSSASTSPSATPMPSPGLASSAMSSWFAPRPVPKATDMDITCLPPAWS